MRLPHPELPHPELRGARSTPVTKLDIAPLAALPLRRQRSDDGVAPTMQQASTDMLGADWPAIFGTPPSPDVEEAAPEPQADPPEKPDPGPFVSETYWQTGSVLGAEVDLAFVRDSREEWVVRKGSTLPDGGRVIAIAAGEVRVQHEDGRVSLIVPPSEEENSTANMQFAEGAADTAAGESARDEDPSGDEWLDDRDDDWDDDWDQAMQDELDEEWQENLDDGWDGQWDED